MDKAEIASILATAGIEFSVETHCIVVEAGKGTCNPDGAVVFNFNLQGQLTGVVSASAEPAAAAA